MGDDTTTRTQALFWAALKVPPAQRSAFLQTECDDPVVRTEVETLLKYHETNDGFLSTPAFPHPAGDRRAGADADQTPDGEMIPTPMPKHIGRYQIKRVIATGGMGTVYEAMQEHPRRAVALKVMRHGIASRSALRRFEYESQILAHLRHPGIAQVYEAGVHHEAQGRVPYFVMEYIPNARFLTAYAREQEIGIRQKLELFAKVCDAVHHGHQKGIIHRDLKPANILIDSAGSPKIIDFGVARATDSDLAVTTLQTDVGQLVGTVQYMSPEQVEADPHDIDIRSDVYALGVVLYELLCGQLPYDVSKARVFEATRIIREKDPAAFSTIKRALHGDVRTIVLKALEKERERRYQSAADLATDIRRYLNNEAIAARPPSVMYQLCVFSRRHRSLAAAVALVAIGLTGATIVSINFAVTAIRAEESTRKETRKLAAVNVFFLEDMFGSVDPAVAQGKELTVREVFDMASKRIASIQEPEIEAEVRNTIGRVYLSLKQRPQADEHLQRALEIRRAIFDGDHDALATSLHNLAECFQGRSEYGQARLLYEEALAMRRRLFGEEHRLVAATMQDLANLEQETGNSAAAEARTRDVLAMRRRLFSENHPEVAESVRCLADVLVSMGKDVEAEEHYRTALAIRREHLGPDHPLVAGTLNNLGILLIRVGRHEEGYQLLREAIDIRRRVLGPDDPRLAQSLVSLGFALIKDERYADAVEPIEEGLRIYRAAHDERHPYVATTLVALGRAHAGADHWDDAVSDYRLAIEIYVDSLGREHWQTANARSHLGECLTKLGHYQQAEEELRAAYDILRQGDVRPDLKSRTEEYLAELYEAWGKPEEALRWQKDRPVRPDDATAANE